MDDEQLVKYCESLIAYIDARALHASKQRNAKEVNKLIDFQMMVKDHHYAYMNMRGKKVGINKGRKHGSGKSTRAKQRSDASK